MDYTDWFTRTYPSLSGHGLWLRGGELNTIGSEEWDARPLRVLISRLSTYRDTADSFTHKLLYQIIAGIDGVFPDLAWLPPPKDAEAFDRDSVPWLLGATSKRGGRDFSVIALSLSIIQEMVNIPVILKKSRIPVSRKERLSDPACPLVILGGASATYTSALFYSDPAVDGIFIGEDAPTIARLFTLCRDACAAGTPKQSILEQLTGIPGFFIPCPSPRVTVFHAPGIPTPQLLTSGPVLTDESCIGKGNLHISEGCACFCSFCAESFARKPYREVDAVAVRNAALEAKRQMGLEDLELYSFNFSMHRDLYAILLDLATLFPAIGLKSQRFDAIAADAGLLDVLHTLDKTSITCGLEGISPRLRRYLHKSLDEEDIVRALRAIVRAKVRELKVFLIATGLETDDDFVAFKAFCASLRTLMQAHGRTFRIIFSMTALVRFPGTPLQFEDAPPSSACASIIGRCGQIARNNGFEFRTAADMSDYWLSQVLVRATDARIGAALFAAQALTGFVYYREITDAFIDAFKRGLADAGVEEGLVLKATGPDARAAKPWRGLDSGVSEEFLVRQWEAARQFVDRGYCASSRDGSGCLVCGACPSDGERQRMPVKPKPERYKPQELRDRIIGARRGERLFRFRVTVLEKARGLPRKIVGLALGRALMLADDRLVEGYRGYLRSLVVSTFGSDWIIGDDIVTLAWDQGCAPVLEEWLVSEERRGRLSSLMDGYGRVDEDVTGDAVPAASLSFESPLPFDGSGYFKARGLTYISHRIGDGLYRFEFSRDALKKKILAAMTVSKGLGGWIVGMTPGPKFQMKEFLTSAFALPSPEEWVRIRILAAFAKGDSE